MDCTQSKDPKVIDALMVDHFDRIRDDPRFRHCLVRVFTEAQMSTIDANRVRNLLSHPRFGLVDIFCEGDPVNAGVFMGPVKKQALAVELQRNMPLLRVAERFLSKDGEGVLAQFCDQLLQMRTEVIPPTSLSKQTGTKILTGKGSGKQDDLVMVYLIALYHAYHSVFRDTAFAALCARLKLRMIC